MAMGEICVREQEGTNTDCDEDAMPYEIPKSMQACEMTESAREKPRVHYAHSASMTKYEATLYMSVKSKQRPTGTYAIIAYAAHKHTPFNTEHRLSNTSIKNNTELAVNATDSNAVKCRLMSRSIPQPISTIKGVTNSAI
jgi:hypothetical protein